MSVYPKLCGMMFMQFGIYGLWLPIAGRFLTADPVTEGGLGFSEQQMGAIVGMAASIGALSSPFIVQFADRRFQAQRFLGVLMILGGILKLLVYPQSTFIAWLLLSVSFTLMFMPAAAICNALAMRHLENPSRQFPGVRLWTAVAWVFMGWTFSLLVLKTNVEPSWLPPFFKGDDVPMVAAEMRKSVVWSGVLAIGYGIWAFFFLPKTPPVVTTTAKRTAVTEAFSLLKVRSFAVMLGVTLIISPMNTIYFMQSAKFLTKAGLDQAYIMPVMALGQFSEILMYLLLGRILPRFGFRSVIAVGIAAFALRFFVFGTVGFPIWVMVLGQSIHGLCYAFFTSTCFIYADKVAPRAIANSAQSLFNFIWYGIGPILAVALNGGLAAVFAASGSTLELLEFRGFWYSLGGITLVGFVIFLIFFRQEQEDAETLLAKSSRN
ncbi:MAG: MFS transporter [Verrucomicrobiales bacterium]